MSEMKTPYYREFYQGQGEVVAGSWGWAVDAGQTNFASVRGEGAGHWRNLPVYGDLNEYKWDNVFLPKGSYKITVIYLKSVSYGIGEILFGASSLATKDMYDAAATYNQIWEKTFALTNDASADMRFRVNGKNVLSLDYRIGFSRFVLQKTG